MLYGCLLHVRMLRALWFTSASNLAALANFLFDSVLFSCVFVCAFCL